MKIRGGIFTKIKKLFEQLREILITNSALSPESILNDLASILIDLADEKHDITFDAAAFFELIIRHSLELLAINHFVDVIVQRYPLPCITFIRSVSSSLVESYKTDIMCNMTSKDCQQMYHRLLDQLTSSTTIISFLNNNLTVSSTNTENDKRTLTSFCGSLLFVVLRHLIALSCKLISIEVNKYSDTIFTTFLTFLDQHFMTNQRSQNEILIKVILIFLVHTSHKTQTIPIFLNVHYPQACLRWLSLSYLSTDDYGCIITILYNIARHDEGLVILNRYECQKALFEFENDTLNTMVDFVTNTSMYKSAHLIATMTIILINDFDKLSMETVSIYTTYLVSAINVAFSKSSAPLLYGMSMLELLVVLMKLCVHDTNIECILRTNQVQKFLFITLKTILSIVENAFGDDHDHDVYFDILTILVLANILWSVSFHDQYKNDFIQNIHLIKRLEQFQATGTVEKISSSIYISRCISSLRRAIDGIYHNLYPPKPHITPINHRLLPSIMISYSYDDIHSCRQLFHLLSKLPQLSVSVDFINGKHLWKETAQTIEQSDLILFLISKKFYISKSCRQEFLYVTQTLKKMFVAVYLDGDYETDEWLKSGLVGSKSIRCERTNLPNTYDKLLSVIEENLRVTISSDSDKTSADIKQWNETDVQQWFANNNIARELYDFYHFDNGNELLLYSQAITGYSWTIEYERIRMRLEEKSKGDDQHVSPYEFSKFIKALKNLKNKPCNKV